MVVTDPVLILEVFTFPLCEEEDLLTGVPVWLLASPGLYSLPDDTVDDCWTDGSFTMAEGDTIPGLGDDPDSTEVSPEPEKE